MDQLFLFNILHGKIDLSRLLERLSLRVPNVHTRALELFLLPTSRSNFLINDPLVRALRSSNINDYKMKDSPNKSFVHNVLKNVKSSSIPHLKRMDLYHAVFVSKCIKHGFSPIFFF